MAVLTARSSRPAVPALVFLILAASAPALDAQVKVTSPREQFGWSIGDDYRLATYTQLTDYWKKLAAESDRLRLVSIGKTAEGRDQWMMIVTSPSNQARIDRLREISARLARGDAPDSTAARALAREGKAIVWIDGGLHATEVLGAHQLMEHVWQMASRTDGETMRLLDDVVQLVVHANPDGMELVSAWYMRRPDETRRSTSGIPRLYQKYIGHDNNRDFYMNAMPESENISRVMYREWYPQIMYNHHQTGPAGTVLFAPPFRDPHNHLIDPLLINGLSMVGAAMHTRFAEENKPGATMRSGASYQTWWNGGLRTTAYFHNQIGILTETIGNPTPIEIPFIPDRQLSTGDLPFPIAPQRWHFRQSIDYSITANRAILDYASRYRETILVNSWRMARNAIEKGSRDSWTVYPSRIERVKAAIERARAERTNPDAGRAGAAATTFGGAAPASFFDEHLRRPEDRDPRGYVIPADQPDFLTATKFVNALLESGVEVHRTTAAVTLAGRSYPAGSYVIKTAQAFRSHVLDLMEPQDYPNDIPYPGGPPRAPYDNAGYTLALQMGVAYDRLLEGFDGPFEKIEGLLPKPAATAPVTDGRGWLIDRRINDGFVAVNRLLAAGLPVSALTEPVQAGGRTWPAGSWYVPGGGRALEILRKASADKGLPVPTAGGLSAGATSPVRKVRIGLWDQYGGSMPSGWVRWIFEQFEFPFEVVYPQQLDAGNLRQRFDVLVFVDGAIPATSGPAQGPGGGGGFGQQPAPDDIPAEFRPRLGRVSIDKTVPQLKAFLDAGGRIVTIGSSTALARHLGLPVQSHLVEREPTGQVRPLPRQKFYIPASLLEVAVDPGAPSALGMPEKVIVLFDESPVLRRAPARGIRPVAWYASASPLRSGWAWGQTYLEGGVAAAEAKVGSGMLYLFTPEITFRSQPHGTYKFLFNAIYAE